MQATSVNFKEIRLHQRGLGGECQCRRYSNVMLVKYSQLPYLSSLHRLRNQNEPYVTGRYHQTSTKKQDWKSAFRKIFQNESGAFIVSKLSYGLHRERCVFTRCHYLWLGNFQRQPLFSFPWRCIRHTREAGKIKTVRLRNLRRRTGYPWCHAT